MKGEGQIRDGLLFLNKALHYYVLKNEEADCLVEIQVIKTPEHYLYKYLFGFLFKDMAEHAGYSVEDIKEEMKDRYAKYKVETCEHSVGKTSLCMSKLVSIGLVAITVNFDTMRDVFPLLHVIPSWCILLALVLNMTVSGLSLSKICFATEPIPSLGNATCS